MNKHGGYRGERKDIIDFSVNINPLGIPEGIKEKLKDGIETLIDYPELSGETVIKKLAKDLSKEPENLILGNGAIELIYLFARSLKPQKALIIQPTFNEYQRALEMYGWEVEHLVLEKEDNFRIQTEKLEQKLKEVKPNLLFLCNPNNPTGVLYSKEEIREWMALPDWEMIWFFDESFMDFTDQLGMLEENLNEEMIFVLKSLTKFYALPGLRIGYGAGNPKLIKKMMRYKEPWSINGLGLIALSEVYQEKDFAKATRELIGQERKKVYQNLASINTIDIYKSSTDFHLCRIKSGQDSRILKGAVEEKGMSLRTCEDFMGLDESYFRIAVKNEKANEQLIKFLEDWKG